MTVTDTTKSAPSLWRRFNNGWATIPMRLFLAALFGFAGYAKLTYPGFFDPNSPIGLKSTIDAVKANSPIGGALGPLSDHPSLFGHITAFAEIAIGLGLLVGLLTRLAALGGIALTTMIALSVNWNGIKEYTGSSGWFTSVDIAVAVALSVYLLGGAGPLSLDYLLASRRARRRAREDAEPRFSDSDLDDSRRRLKGEDEAPSWAHPADHPTQQLPVQEAQSPTHTLYPDDEVDQQWTQGRRDTTE